MGKKLEQFDEMEMTFYRSKIITIQTDTDPRKLEEQNEFIME